MIGFPLAKVTNPVTAVIANKSEIILTSMLEASNQLADSSWLAFFFSVQFVVIWEGLR